jgi:hypothetical protein
VAISRVIVLRITTPGSGLVRCNAAQANTAPNYKIVLKTAS